MSAIVAKYFEYVISLIFKFVWRQSFFLMLQKVYQAGN